MGRVFDDLGHVGKAVKPIGLRVYEPGALPDPGQCAHALIVVNDRSDGVPRARLMLSNGASWDPLAFTFDRQAGVMPTTVDVTPIIRQAVSEQLPALVQVQQPAMRVISPAPSSDAPSIAHIRQEHQQTLQIVAALLDRVAVLEERLAFVEQHGATTQLEMRVS